MARNVKPKRKTARTKLAGPVELKGANMAAPALDIDDVLRSRGREYMANLKRQLINSAINDAAEEIACALEGRDGRYYSVGYKSPKTENVVLARRILQALRTYNTQLAEIDKSYADYGV